MPANSFWLALPGAEAGRRYAPRLCLGELHASPAFVPDNNADETKPAGTKPFSGFREGAMKQLTITKAIGNDGKGIVMADRSGLRLVGYIFASVTIAIMLVATAVVTKSYADGGVYALDESAPIDNR